MLLQLGPLELEGWRPEHSKNLGDTLMAAIRLELLGQQAHAGLCGTGIVQVVRAPMSADGQPDDACMPIIMPTGCSETFILAQARLDAQGWGFQEVVGSSWHCSQNT